jgi:hypothetical protein
MSAGHVRVVLHTWRINGRVWADESLVDELRARGFDVTTEKPEPEPEGGATFHGDSVIDYLVEHFHVYLSHVATFAAGTVTATLKGVIVDWAKTRIQRRREFRHRTTVTIYGADGRPVKEVMVTGHGDEKPEIIERP